MSQFSPILFLQKENRKANDNQFSFVTGVSSKCEQICFDMSMKNISIFGAHSYRLFYHVLSKQLRRSRHSFYNMYTERTTRFTAAAFDTVRRVR